MFSNLVAPINELGYGVASFQILKSLIKKGFPVSLFVIGEPQLTEQRDVEIVKMAMNNAKFFSPDAPSVRIFHQFSLDMFPGRGRKIGWPIFEVNKFNDLEKHHLNAVDELIVCSEWAKKVIEENGIKKKVHVVPLGVDTEFYKPNPNVPKHKNTIFLNIGKWEKRKGHEELIAAFNKAFKEDDNVELWMLTDNPFIGSKNDEWKNMYLNTPLGFRCRFFPRLPNANGVLSIIQQSDCGVFPTKAEGWCLPALDMLACGKEVIITNATGQTQWCQHDSVRKLTISGTEKAEDGIWFKGDGEWATVDVNELANHMLEVHRIRQNIGNRLFNEAGVNYAQKFTWDKATDEFLKVLF